MTLLDRTDIRYGLVWACKATEQWFELPAGLFRDLSKAVGAKEYLARALQSVSRTSCRAQAAVGLSKKQSVALCRKPGHLL